MVAQAFFYNAIFFTYALILTDFYGIPARAVGWYILPFAAGNVLGPILLGRLFDTVGRKIMIASTYALSGIMLAVTAYLFSQNLLTATTLTVAWMIGILLRLRGGELGLSDRERDFSAGDSRARHRLLLCHRHRHRRHRRPAAVRHADLNRLARQRRRGYAIGAILMAAAAVVQARWGVAAERKSLEAVSRPLAFID